MHQNSLPTLPRAQTRGEERANTLSHALGIILAILCCIFLLPFSAQHPTHNNATGVSLFVASLFILYASSTLYHAVPPGRLKRVLMRVDHCAIFLFIAGTYTPFTLGVLSGAWGWTLFGLVWGIAGIGITLKGFNLLNRPWLSNTLYLMMGWIVLIAINPVTKHVPWQGIALLVAGGVAYSVGVIFFVLDSRIKYGHSIWHGFVLLGTIAHIFAVLYYSTP